MVVKGAPRPPAAPRSGLTLLELLLVMGLLAMLLGAGLGSLSSLDPGRRAALGVVQNALRTAHNTALARRAPARVRIDREARTITAEGMRVIGTWHFEDGDLAGVDGMDGVLIGADVALVENGFLGSALCLTDAPRGSRVEVSVQDDPAYDLELGFAIDLVLRPDDLRGARLLAIGDAFEAHLTGLGGVSALFHRLEIDALGVPRRGRAVHVETAPGVLRPGRWTRLRFEYDRRALRILADGVALGVTHSSEAVWRVEGPLVLCGGGTMVAGAIDELVLAVLDGSQVVTLPGDVAFGAGAPAFVHFAAGGALDGAQHPGPVTIPIELGDGRTETVLVSLYGTVE